MENEYKTLPVSVLHSLSIKNNFYDKTDFK